MIATAFWVIGVVYFEEVVNLTGPVAACELSFVGINYRLKINR